jgi:hypothetical protein
VVVSFADEDTPMLEHEIVLPFKVFDKVAETLE